MSKEVADLFRRALILNVKMRNLAPLPEPPEITTLAPCQLSYWVASLFADSPKEQQRASMTLKRFVGTVK